jgi:predicted O-methyltransferase YrrM
MKRAIKSLIPSRLKAAAKAALRSYRLRRGVRAISQLNDGELPTRAMLQSLSLGWGNDGYAANLDYLQEIAKNAAATAGPVLECGSGLTTLLLGMLAGRRGVEVRSLEHSALWQQRIAAVLSENRIANVEVLSSPLRDYGDFSWYDPPLQKLPDHFQLVVCDGPPGQTKGGRYGLLPVFGARFREGTVVVLDDADRPGEVELVNRWKDEADLEVEVFNKPAGSFARLVRLS